MQNGVGSEGKGERNRRKKRGEVIKKREVRKKRKWRKDGKESLSKSRGAWSLLF